MTEAISVIIPTFNGSRFIADALRSVFAQTRLPVEIIVVDDHSTDATPNVVEALKQESPVPLQLIRLERNSGGPARPTNVGIEATCGQLIAVLDQDDVFASDKLATQSELLERDPSLACAGGLAGKWSDGRAVEPAAARFADSVLKLTERRGDHWVIPAPAVEIFLTQGMLLIGFPSFMFRKSAWEKAGRIDETLRIVGDFDFACRLTLEGGLGLIPKTAYYRRNHADNLTRDRVRMYCEDANVRDRLINGSLLRENSHLRSIAAKHCLYVAYWFREDALYSAACRMLRMALRFGAPTAEVVKQLGLVAAHGVLYRLGLRNRVPSGVSRPPWELYGEAFTAAATETNRDLQPTE